MKGILLDDDFDLKIRNGSVQIGESIMQDAEVVISITPGTLKSDPLLGPKLTKFIRGKAGRTEIQRIVKIHLQRAGISWDEIKDKLNINTEER